MALVSRTQDPILANTLFITKNLPSLQFESSLTEEEKELLPLRLRSHAILVTQCALSTVIINNLSSAKRSISQLLDFQKGQVELEDAHNFTVGIIGCGQLGSQIAQSLLTIGQLEPKKLHISTRRPDSLGHLTQKGVHCYYDNRRLISSVDAVLLCVLPSQAPGVAQEIKDVILPSQIIICPFSSFSLSRLCKLLGSDNLLPLGVHCSDLVHNLNFNYTVGVIKALENKNVVLGTCPIGVNKEGLMACTDEKVAECLVLAVANLCTVQGCSIDQTLTTIAHSIFGDNNKNKGQHSHQLTIKDFGIGQSINTHERSFPHFNLVESYKNGTPLLKHLQANRAMQASFATRYWHIFDDYIYKLTFGHLQ